MTWIPDHRSRRVRSVYGAVGVVFTVFGLTAEPAVGQDRPVVPPFSAALALETFDSVWHRVANTHYDPDMEGVDWDAVRRELEPRASEAKSNVELRIVLEEMLGRLGLSHFAILGAGAGDDLVDAAGGGGPADPGLELRLVNEELLVVRIRAGSPAERVGVGTGWSVTRIGGRDPSILPAGVGDALARAGASPDRIRALHLPARAHAALQGAEGTPIDVTFVDGEGVIRSLELDRSTPPADVVRFGHLPPFPIVVEDRSISLPDGGTGAVIRFTGWFPAATPLLADAVDRYRDADGIILDLRGNPGGVGAMAMGVGGHFIDEAVELGVMRTRTNELRFVISPQRVSPAGARVFPFAGPLAILVDPLTASTSEIFAAGMQGLGRARVFGEVTAGQALPSVIVSLPNGDHLMHAIADYLTANGERIEGRGVIPDERVAPERERLLEGTDPAMDRAVEWIVRTRASDPIPPVP